MEFRVGHILVPFAIISHNQKPFRLTVKTPHRGESVVMEFGKVVHYNRKQVIPVSGHAAKGLVEHIIMFVWIRKTVHYRNSPSVRQHKILVLPGMHA